MQQGAQWSLVFHLDHEDGGELGVMRCQDGQHTVTRLPVQSDGEASLMLLGVDAQGKAILMDRAKKSILVQAELPAHALAAYAYPDTRQGAIWFMVDGDKKTGCDALNCGTQGSSVTVIDRSSPEVSVLATVCVGRGHHVTTFLYPDDTHQGFRPKAYVSNLLDGSISVVGNDPADPARYLQVIKTISLFEADREAGASSDCPNQAFPHGKVYSARTGKVYSLNNGYGTVAVLDPVKDEIEARFDLKVTSNLLLSPDGRYIVGKGADRKKDAEHVVGRLTLIDAQSYEQLVLLDLPDIYPSTYRFNPAGDRLYVTSAATGQGVQRDNIRKDIIQVYDASQFPKLVLLREVQVGRADCGRRPIGFLAGATGAQQRVFVPNPTDGTLTILSGEGDTTLDVVDMGGTAVKEFSFSIWCEAISAC